MLIMNIQKGKRMNNPHANITVETVGHNVQQEQTKTLTFVM